MRHYTREELLDLAAGYAMGALNAEETAAVERALATEPGLAAEVHAYHETMTSLARGETLAPSPEVRERLLAAVRADAGQPSANGAHPLDVPRAVPPPTVVRPLRRALFGTGLGAALAASLVVAAGLARHNALLRDEVRAASAAGDSAREKLEHRERTLNSLLHAENFLHVVHLYAADTVRGPGVQLFWDERHHVGVLHAFRMPPAPRGRSYQLWTLVNGAPVSAKVFDTDPDGHALVENLALPTTVRGVTDVVITVEPAGGSALPTGPAVLRGILRGG